MKLWTDLLNVSLLGTERQALSFASESEALDRLISSLDQNNRETALLGALVIVSSYHRAGALPFKDDSPLPAVCEDDGVLICGNLAMARLAMMLRGEQQDLLPEWLKQLAMTGKRVPEELLVPLLELGRTKSSLREFLLPVLGKRGAWLASVNPVWKYADEKFDEQSWLTGGSGARLAYLRKLRATNAAAARELIQSVWKESTQDERGNYLVAFEVGLSLDDEPFLELALADKSKGVRRGAAKLLALIPQSGLSQKLIDRVRPLLKVKAKARGKKCLDVTLPESTEEEMAELGINPKPANYSNLGDRAWWLRQLVGMAPPSIWNASLETTADDLIKLVLANEEWRTLLLDAFGMAAKDHQDREWIEALFNHQMVTGFSLNLHSLLVSLPVELKEEFALRSLRQGMDAFTVLKACSHPWGGILSLTALKALSESIRKNQVDDGWQWPSLLNQMAVSLNPDQIPEAVREIGSAMQNKPKVPKSLEKFLDSLRFRDEMLKEINQ